MDEQTLSYYNKNASSFVENTKNVLMSDAWNYFTELLPKTSLVLDFGCGAGRDTKFFLEHGYRVEALDGSESLCNIASAFTGIHVEKMFFCDFKAENKYDGIWACSSLLHVSKKELPSIIKKIEKALKQEGIFYTSFKYGAFEGMRNGRYFTDMTEESFKCLIQDIPHLEITKMWISSDVRPKREHEKWLNVLLKKK